MVGNTLRVFCTVPVDHRRSWLNKVVSINYSHLINLWLVYAFLAPENMVSMATNRCILLFYFILLKFKPVSHLLSNRHEISTKASLIILIKKSGFHFWITTSGVELCGDRLLNCKLQWTLTTLTPHSSTFEVDIQKWKLLFISKIIKEAFMKISCVLDRLVSIQVR